MLAWADLVLVMKRKHAARLRKQFPYLNEWPEVHCLDIPDEFQFMDQELIDLIRTKVEPMIS